MCFLNFGFGGLGGGAAANEHALAQPVKKFTKLYGIRIFITVFTTAHYFSLS
jgi:hypothetical protein